MSRSEPSDPTAPTPPQELAQGLRSLGTEKEAAQRECQDFLSERPVGSAALHLPVVLNSVKNKYSDTMALCDLYGDK